MKIFYLIDFLIFYVGDLVLGALRVAQDVITPQKLSTPGIIKFPLTAKSDFEIALLSNLITFSPGSMVVDIDEDKSHLYIHIVFLENKDEAIQTFKEKFEARVLKVLR
jgi:multicomponent Na+:H+ antiporter subunit E